MLVMNATVLLSADQLVPPTNRVVYSFAIENGWTSRFSTLLVICLGSVIGCAGRHEEVCAMIDDEKRKMAANENNLNIALVFTTGCWVVLHELRVSVVNSWFGVLVNLHR